MTGAYVYAMANNYNGVPRPPVVFCSGGARARGRAPRDLRGPLWPETFRVGLLGHGTVGAAFETLLAERAGRGRRGHRAAAGADRRADALARRLRRDPRRLAT